MVRRAIAELLLVCISLTTFKAIVLDQGHLMFSNNVAFALKEQIKLLFKVETF